MSRRTQPLTRWELRTSRLVELTTNRPIVLGAENHLGRPLTIYAPRGIEIYRPKTNIHYRNLAELFFLTLPEDQQKAYLTAITEKNEIPESEVVILLRQPWYGPKNSGAVLDKLMPEGRGGTRLFESCGPGTNERHPLYSIVPEEAIRAVEDLNRHIAQKE